MFYFIYFFLQSKEGNLIYRQSGGREIKKILSTKTPYNSSSKVTCKKSRSHSPESPEWNKVVYEEKKNEKKNLTVLHTQYKAPPILIPISNIGQECGHYRKKGPHIGCKKQNKKNWKELNKLNTKLPYTCHKTKAFLN